MAVFVVAFWCALIPACIALLAAAVHPARRARELRLASTLFALAGILAILSVGIVLIALAALLAWWAARVDG